MIENILYKDEFKIYGEHVVVSPSKNYCRDFSVIVGFNEPATISKITEDDIFFSNGYSITFYHRQACCEKVYADFKAIKDTPLISYKFKSIIIEPVFGSGFKLNGELIPCYNIQNGFYSDELIIWIMKDNKLIVSIDLSGFAEDIIE